MSTIPDRTPVIVGVGQVVDRIEAGDYRALSAADLAAAAAEAALADSGAAALVRPQLRVVGAVRTFEDSGAAPSPFGKPDKFPLAVARRLGVTPDHAILGKVGGDTPVSMVMELGDRILAGETEAAIAFGAEAISTTRHLSGRGETRDWTEHDEGTIDDRDLGYEGMLSAIAARHGVRGAPIAYALLENARRARLGLSREDYAREMGRLFAPFTQVAAANPWSCSASAPMTAEQIATPGERNRIVADPYTLKLVARDQVNQGAAVLLMAAGAARAAGIPEDRWIFVHGAALAVERELLDRPALDRYPAADAAIASAFASAGKTAADMAAFDFYSCFPIPVFTAATEGLGLSGDDPRGLTVTGGLPYFGGAGNNYSMHAIASMAERLRREAGSFGFVGANGGFQSKYGAMVLSGEPHVWPGCEKDSIQAQLDAAPKPVITAQAQGTGTIGTYTVAHTKGVPTQGIAIGALADGTRFIANPADAATLARMAETDPLGARVTLTAGEKTNTFVFAE
ncbi:acetyl-CoA acetyltransferase [Novosphingobium sp. MD-1]|uniref:acetyl-CoA acetyltransferase n=1 Tax=Novosphingobium sp. MD-1 TaxID=1630648 RepID=UPI00061BC950|nr:acetyl-CoA acetyltransferase [Novosphingobium sp. MD-1]GAO55566.1 acetyl-CoA acetyltransferase [Novosphingobium sp. MD-1]